MHGNAAIVAIVLAAFAARADARLSKPAPAAPLPRAASPALPQATSPVARAAPPVAPAAVAKAAVAAPVVTPAARAAPAAKAPGEPESDGAVQRALATTGRTYEALKTQAAGGRIQGPGGGSRAEQAKQLIAQLHPKSQKPPQPVQVAVQPTPQAHSLPAPVVFPTMPRRQLDAELLDAESQVKNKLKEINVQTRLEKEKEEAAAQAQKRAVELRGRAKKLRSEANVAAQIAKEKSEAAAKAEKGMKQSQGKAEKILEEEQVMRRFLNQTRKEEIALEHNVSNLKIDEARAIQAEKVVTKAAATQAPKKPAGNSTATATKAAAPMDNEAMKKLLEENNRLKHEKAVLEQKLSDRKVAKEKAKLKQKLKNRLALADRHMKLQKRMLRVPHLL